MYLLLYFFFNRDLPEFFCFLIGRIRTSPTYVASSPVRLEYSAIRVSNSCMDSMALRLSSTLPMPPNPGGAAAGVRSAPGASTETADNGMVVLACGWTGVLDDDDCRGCSRGAAGGNAGDACPGRTLLPGRRGRFDAAPGTRGCADILLHARRVFTNTINTIKTVIISTFNIINAVMLILLVQT